MNQKLKQRFKAITLIIVTMILLTNQSDVLSEGEYIVVRVVGAEYPPLTRVITEGHLTIFEFDIEIEIDNPTNSNIAASQICGPFPYPEMSTNLDDKNITAIVSVNHEWLARDFYYPPGITKRTILFGMDVMGYENPRFPMGEYRIWFNFT